MDVGRGSTAAEEWWNAEEEWRHWQQAEREQIALYRAQSCAWCHVSFATEPAGAQPIERGVQSASKIRVEIVPGIPTCPIQEDIVDGLKQRTSASIVMLAGQQPAETVGYSTTSGNSSSVAPVTDSCADFAASDSRAIYLGNGFSSARSASGQTQTCPPMKVAQGRTTTMMTTTTTINHL